MQEQVAKLTSSPDVLISTPGRLVPHLREGALVPACRVGVHVQLERVASCPPPPPPHPVLEPGRLTLKDSLEMLVIDEADQVLLYGYGDDVKEIVVSLPAICQVCGCLSAFRHSL